MKKLPQFSVFDFEAFSKGKLYLCTGQSEWKDYNTGEHLGTKVDVVIYRDDTAYVQKEGESVSNRFEKLTFKVNKDVEVPVEAIIEPVDAVATIYGDYRNLFSVKCADIKVLRTKSQNA